jgi:hypothetical protein
MMLPLKFSSARSRSFLLISGRAAGTKTQTWRRGSRTWARTGGARRHRTRCHGCETSGERYAPREDHLEGGQRHVAADEEPAPDQRTETLQDHMELIDAGRDG